MGGEKKNFLRNLLLKNSQLQTILTPRIHSGGQILLSYIEKISARFVSRQIPQKGHALFQTTVRTLSTSMWAISEEVERVWSLFLVSGCLSVCLESVSRGKKLSWRLQQVSDAAKAGIPSGAGAQDTFSWPHPTLTPM